jgi:hypothetical protein
VLWRELVTHDRGESGGSLRKEACQTLDSGRHFSRPYCQTSNWAAKGEMLWRRILALEG